MQINLNPQAAISSAALHIQSGKGFQAQKLTKEGSASEEASESPAAQLAEAGKGAKVNVIA